MKKDLFKVDPRSKLPLYDQIERNLRDLITDGAIGGVGSRPFFTFGSAGFVTIDTLL